MWEKKKKKKKGFLLFIKVWKSYKIKIDYYLSFLFDYTQHTAHSTQQAAHSKQHTASNTQHTAHSTQHTAHSTRTQHTFALKQDTQHTHTMSSAQKKEVYPFVSETTRAQCYKIIEPNGDTRYYRTYTDVTKRFLDSKRDRFGTAQDWHDSIKKTNIAKHQEHITGFYSEASKMHVFKVELENTIRFFGSYFDAVSFLTDEQIKLYYP